MDVMLDLVVDPGSVVPAYEQLRVGVAGLIASGRLEPGARLATVRQLATDLGLAPNTVARAYRLLEADGLISTHGRRGTFVSSAGLAAPPQEVASQARAFALVARRHGLTSSEALRLVEEAWGTAPG